MSFKKIEISEITFFDADGNELIGAKIAPGQVAGNSNLKFGVRPRASCTVYLHEASGRHRFSLPWPRHI